jgi:hypothetical protein
VNLLPKDREVIFISNVERAAIKNLNQFRKSKSEEYYYNDIYSFNLKQPHIQIKYMTRGDGGDLRISFNPIKHNFSQHQGLLQASIDAFINDLSLSLSDIINLNDLVYYKRILVSKDETCINLIIPSEDIDSILNVISKIRMPRYKISTKYLNKGSVYFYTGETDTKSGVSIRAYDKTKELKEKGCILNEENLKDMAILRIELASKRAKIRREFNKSNVIFHTKGLNKNHKFIILKQKHKMNEYNSAFYNLSGSRYANIIKAESEKTLYINAANSTNCTLSSQYKILYLRREFNLKELEYMMLNTYEHDVFYSLINNLHLDKKIVIRAKLFKKIERTSKLSKTEKTAAKRVVKYLNGENVPNSEKISEYSIRKYIKFILSLGYHYIYSDKEIGDVIKCGISTSPNIIDIKDYVVSYA